MKKVLLTGAGGFLGARANVCFRELGWDVTSVGHRQLDICNAAQVQQVLRDVRPDAVLHFAAVSSTAVSQQQPALSHAVNVQGTENLAAACAQTGSRLVYMSSDQVYNGCLAAGPLAEDTPLAPENVYGCDKLEAERRVARLCPNAVGLRLTWMYDVPRAGLPASGNLICSVLRAALSGVPQRFAVRETRGVTWVWDVVHSLPALLEVPGGVYNAGSSGTQSTYTLALETAAALGCAHPEAFVLPDSERYAQHVRNLSMDTSLLAAFGITFPENMEGVHTCLAACSWPV